MDNLQKLKFPDALIVNPLGAASKDEDHVLAKSGDVHAAARLAQKLVTTKLIVALKEKIPSNTIVVAVNSIEETGKNALPIAAAKIIADHLKIELDCEIVQSTQPKRTNLNGLDRIFSSPKFKGPVKTSRPYLLVDDTITQGRTFISLAQHIEKEGGQVVSIIALTGKQYSSKITPDQEQITQVRTLYGDIEHEFEQATGYNFERLTASEARYLVTFKGIDLARDRILAQADARADRNLGENLQRDETHAVAASDNLLHQAQSAASEQRALLENASLEQTLTATLKPYVEAKHEQIERIEARLGQVIEQQQNKMKQTKANPPKHKWLSSKKTKTANTDAWYTRINQQQKRLYDLEYRQSLIGKIKAGTDSRVPNINELATRKMRREHPGLAASWDAMRESVRLKQQQERQQREKQAQQKEQSQGHSQGYSLSHRLRP